MKKTGLQKNGYQLAIASDDCMKINRITGLLDIARQVPSPNCDDRPLDGLIELIVVHNISLPPGEFGGEGINNLFTNSLDVNEHPFYLGIAGLRVSAHVLIRRSGEVVQYVPFHRRAWHAGQSEYCGRTACNDFSVGIELEGIDDRAYEEVQYQMLAGVIKSLLDTYITLSAQSIVGHSDIAPGRKTDPGPLFDWLLLGKLLDVM